MTNRLSCSFPMALVISLALYLLQKGQASRISMAKSLPLKMKAMLLDSLTVSATFL